MLHIQLKSITHGFTHPASSLFSDSAATTKTLCGRRSPTPVSPRSKQLHTLTLLLNQSPGFAGRMALFGTEAESLLSTGYV